MCILGTTWEDHDIEDQYRNQGEKTKVSGIHSRKQYFT